MKIAHGLIAATAVFISAQAANAQQLCVPHDKAVLQLKKQFNEQVAGRGLAADGKQMIELFVSETGSWTMLLSEPSGHACIVASGKSWQEKTLESGDPA